MYSISEWSIAHNGSIIYTDTQRHKFLVESMYSVSEWSIAGNGSIIYTETQILSEVHILSANISTKYN